MNDNLKSKYKPATNGTLEEEPEITSMNGLTAYKMSKIIEYPVAVEEDNNPPYLTLDIGIGKQNNVYGIVMGFANAFGGEDKAFPARKTYDGTIEITTDLTYFSDPACNLVAIRPDLLPRNWEEALKGNREALNIIKAECYTAQSTAQYKSVKAYYAALDSLA